MVSPAFKPSALKSTIWILPEGPSFFAYTCAISFRRSAMACGTFSRATTEWLSPSAVEAVVDLSSSLCEAPACVPSCPTSQGCCSAPLMEIRFSGSLHSILVIRSLQSRDARCGIFGSFSQICRSSRNGNVASTNPYITTPQAQVSAGNEYRRPQNSGDQNTRVPVSWRRILPFWCAIAVPKSETTSLQSGSSISGRSISTLSPLMSRCKYPFWWMCSTAENTWLHKRAQTSSGIFPFFLRWSCKPSTRSPPENFGITMQTKHFSWKTATNPTMFGWSRETMTSISRVMSEVSDSARSIIFTAYQGASSLSFERLRHSCTTPKAPSPSLRPRRYWLRNSPSPETWEPLANFAPIPKHLERSVILWSGAR
mmetsp:Transcript_3043/g.7061  ORF Transcript_3043/g.7061 Transcript_3043/m.7061 type:complete len:369 (-) Transcript_3043:228-1334(-)